MWRTEKTKKTEGTGRKPDCDYDSDGGRQARATSRGARGRQTKLAWAPPSGAKAGQHPRRGGEYPPQAERELPFPESRFPRVGKNFVNFVISSERSERVVKNKRF